MIRTTGLAWVLGWLATTAVAQATQDPMEVCYQQPDGVARLACFNHEMQRRHAAAASTPAPAAAPPPAVVATPAKKAAPDIVGLQGADLRRKLKEEGIPAEPIKPIVATIVRLLPRPGGEYAFELDNAQTWEQAEAKSDLNVRAHDTVTIKPGVLGAFYMTTSRSQRVRVRRSR